MATIIDGMGGGPVGDGFQVDPEAMRSSGANLAAAGEQFGGSLEQFDATIASYGTPWGGDDIGMLIGMAYEAAVDYAMQNFYSAANEIVGAGEDVIAMADAYQQTEESTRAMFTGNG